MEGKHPRPDGLPKNPETDPMAKHVAATAEAEAALFDKFLPTKPTLAAELGIADPSKATLDSLMEQTVREAEVPSNLSHELGISDNTNSTTEQAQAFLRDLIANEGKTPVVPSKTAIDVGQSLEIQSGEVDVPTKSGTKTPSEQPRTVSELSDRRKQQPLSSTPWWKKPRTRIAAAAAGIAAFFSSLSQTGEKQLEKPKQPEATRGAETKLATPSEATEQALQEAEQTAQTVFRGPAETRPMEDEEAVAAVRAKIEAMPEQSIASPAVTSSETTTKSAPEASPAKVQSAKRETPPPIPEAAKKSATASSSPERSGGGTNTVKQLSKRDIPNMTVGKVTTPEKEEVWLKADDLVMEEQNLTGADDTLYAEAVAAGDEIAALDKQIDAIQKGQRRVQETVAETMRQERHDIEDDLTLMSDEEVYDLWKKSAKNISGTSDDQLLTLALDEQSVYKGKDLSKSDKKYTELAKRVEDILRTKISQKNNEAALPGLVKQGVDDASNPRAGIEESIDNLAKKGQ